MSAAKFDKKEALEVFKYLNIGGVLAVLVIAAVAGVMYGSGCGPVGHSSNWGDHRLSGAPVMQDHPEQAPAADHAAPAADHEAPAAH